MRRRRSGASRLEPFGVGAASGRPVRADRAVADETVPRYIRITRAA